jgi:quinol monooxygenase YgiN
VVEHAHVVRIARMRPVPGQRDALLERLHAQAEAMRSLPGLFGVQVCELQEDPNSLALISRWKAEADMQRVDANGPEIRRAAELIEHEDVEHFVSI